MTAGDKERGMGYSAEAMNDGGDGQYIGSISMMSMANAGLFDSECSQALIDRVAQDDSIMAAIEADDVQDMIKNAKLMDLKGKWISKFIAWAETHGEGGIIIRY